MAQVTAKGNRGEWKGPASNLRSANRTVSASVGNLHKVTSGENAIRQVSFDNLLPNIY